MEILGLNPSIKMARLVGIFSYKENMLAESLKLFASALAELYYEDLGEQAPMGFMVSGGGFHYVDASYWLDQKHPSFISPTFSEDTNWDTSAMHMSVVKEEIIKSTFRFNAPLGYWGFTNSLRYHA